MKRQERKTKKNERKKEGRVIEKQGKQQTEENCEIQTKKG